MEAELGPRKLEEAGGTRHPRSPWGECDPPTP